MSGMTFAAAGLSSIFQLAAGIEGYRQGSDYAQVLRIQGAEARRQANRAGAKVLGRTVAVASKQGRNPYSGSAYDILLENAMEEALTADIAAFGFEMEAQNAENVATADLVAGISGSVTTAIQGISLLPKFV